MGSFEDDEIWNEFQWESHLNEMDQKNEQLREYIESSLGENSPRWSRFLNGFPTKLDAIDAYIEDELMFEDAYFPDDEDDWEDEDDEMDDFFMSSVEDDDDFDDFDDDGEAWKMGLETSDVDPIEPEDILEWFSEAMMDEIPDPENIEIYDEARELAADMLKLAEIVPKDEQDEDFIRMVSETVNVGAKLAGGFAFGFDLDVLGGNIAYCKRALQSANNVLELLFEMKDRSFMRYVDYESLHERMFDLRNDIGVHIQELREDFNSELEE